MQLSKFVKITGFALGFLDLVSSYGDKQVVWLWEVEKAKQMTEKGEEFMYYIQDIATLMNLLEFPDKYTDGTYKISEDCLLKLLEDSNAISVINTIDLNTINLEKVKSATRALQIIVLEKTKNESPEWNEIVMPYGEFYYSNDCLMFHEILESDQVDYNEAISDSLKRLSEAEGTDDVFSVLYGQAFYEVELSEMGVDVQIRRDRTEPSFTPASCATSSELQEQIWRRDKSRSSSTVPSRVVSPDL